MSVSALVDNDFSITTTSHYALNSQPWIASGKQNLSRRRNDHPISIRALKKKTEMLEGSCMPKHAVSVCTQVHMEFHGKLFTHHWRDTYAPHWTRSYRSRWLYCCRSILRSIGRYHSVLDPGKRLSLERDSNLLTPTLTLQNLLLQLTRIAKESVTIAATIAQ